MKKLIFAFIFLLNVIHQSYGQNNCNTFVKVIDSLNGPNPKIFPTNTTDYYVTGVKNNAPILIQCTQFGIPITSKTWKLSSFPNNSQIFDLIVDPTNVVGLVQNSTSLTSTVFKMNRTTGVILWTQQFASMVLYNVHQTGGSYWVTGSKNSQYSFIANLNFSTGAIISQRTFDTGISGIGEFYSTLSPSGEMCGSSRRYYSASDLRGSIWKYDLLTNTVPWQGSYITAGSATTNTRMYPIAPVYNNSDNTFITAHSGDLLGLNTYNMGNTELVLTKTNIQFGGLAWTIQYSLTGRKRIQVQNVLTTAGGYYIIGNLNSNTVNNYNDKFFIIKTDLGGLPLWAKQYGISGRNKVFAAFEKGGYLHLSATSDSYGGIGKVIMLKLDAMGMSTNTCDLISDIQAHMEIMPNLNNPLTTTVTDQNLLSSTHSITTNFLKMKTFTSCCQACTITPSITGNTNICPGNSTTLVASGGTSYVWSNGQTTSSISVSPTTNTIYTVTATDSLGCTGTATITVNILPIPNAVIMGDSIICNSDTTTLTASGGNEYSWSPGGQTTPSISVTAPGTYCATVTNIGPNLITNGDFSAGNTGFTTGYNYVAYWYYCNYFIAPSFFGYSGANNALTDHSPSSDNMFMSVDGCSAPNTLLWQQTVSGLTPNTNYKFSFWVMSGSTNPPYFFIEVNGTLQAALTSIGLSTAASPVWELMSFTWNSGTNTTATFSVRDMELVGFGNDFALDDFSLQSLGCTTTICHTITSFTPTIAGESIVCPGDTAHLTASSGASYLWSPGGATTQTISVITPGTYCAAITSLGTNLITNGDFSAGNIGFTSGYSNISLWSPCNNYVGSSFFGYPGPSYAMFDHSPSSDNMFMSVDGCTTANTIVWEQNVTNITPNKNYQFSFWVLASTINPSNFNIKVNGITVSTWTPSGLQPLWEQHSFIWNSGTNTSAIFTIDDTQLLGFGNDYALDDIALQALGCTSTVCHTVMPCCTDLNVDYTYSTTDLVPNANTITFGAPNVTGCTGTLSYFWDLGDGMTSTNASPGTVTYTTPCTKHICLTVTCTNQDSTKCVKTCCKDIYVPGDQLNVNANFSYAISSLNADFTAPPQAAGNIYTWNIYNNSNTLIHSATSSSITGYTFPTAGTFKVCLEVTTPYTACFGRSTKICREITVMSPCITLPSMDILQHSTSNPLTVQFSNTSIGYGLTQEWDFGDGTPVDNSANPIHTYINSGIGVVCLTINKGMAGCETKVCNAINIGSADCDSTTMMQTQANKMANPNNDNSSSFNGQTVNHESNEMDVLKEKLDQENLISIFPNPTNGNSTIQLATQFPSSSQLVVYDMEGKERLKQNVQANSKTIDLKSENFAPGMYIIRLVNDQKVYILKLTKN